MRDVQKVPVTMACRLMGLRMEERPQDIEDSSQYNEYAVAESRHGVALQPWG